MVKHERHFSRGERVRWGGLPGVVVEVYEDGACVVKLDHHAGDASTVLCASWVLEAEELSKEEAR